MSAQRQHEVWFSEADYLSVENGTDVKHEYFDGQIYAMAGATPRHNRITLAVASSLHQQLRGRMCEVFSSDQRLKVEATGLRTYPDVLVVCPPQRFDCNDAIALVDATVVIEVLSPSTAAYDRGTKFDSYRQLPSLRHYLLIEPARVEVQHRFLGASGEWEIVNFTSANDAVILDGIGCTLSLADVYEAIELDAI